MDKRRANADALREKSYGRADSPDDPPEDNGVENGPVSGFTETDRISFAELLRFITPQLFGKDRANTSRALKIFVGSAFAVTGVMIPARGSMLSYIKKFFEDNYGESDVDLEDHRVKASKPDIDSYIESVYEGALFDAFQASMAKLYADGYISFDVFHEKKLQEVLEGEGHRLQ